MAVRFVRWVFTQTKEPAEDSADQERVQQLVTDLTFIPDPQPFPAAGVVALIPGLYDVHLTSAVLYVPGAVAGGDTPAQQDLSPAGFAVTHTTDVTDPHTSDATTTAALNDSIFRGNIQIQVPVATPYIRLSGAALAAWVPAPSTCQALVTYNHGRGRSHSEFGGFVDDTTDTFPGVGNTSRLLLTALLQQPTGSYTVENQGKTLTIAQVAYFTMSPTGDVWVRNSQIGSQGNQIPPSAADNSPERYAFHPAVFIRRTGTIASLEAVSDPRTPAITATEGVLAIWQVVRAPTHSRWLFILDGVPREVIIAHGAGTDLRTPTEIWNGVILPIIQGAGASSLTLHNVRTFGALLLFTTSGAMSLGQVRSLDYARFLEAYDANAVVPIVTLYAQVL